MGYFLTSQLNEEKIEKIFKRFSPSDSSASNKLVEINIKEEECKLLEDYLKAKKLQAEFVLNIPKEKHYILYKNAYEFFFKIFDSLLDDIEEKIKKKEVVPPHLMLAFRIIHWSIKWRMVTILKKKSIFRIKEFWEKSAQLLSEKPEDIGLEKKLVLCSFYLYS